MYIYKIYGVWGCVTPLFFIVFNFWFLIFKKKIIIGSNPLDMVTYSIYWQVEIYHTSIGWKQMHGI